MYIIVKIAFVLTGLLPLALSSFRGDIYSHDPSFIRSGHCYYIFCTGDGGFHHGTAPIRKLCNDQSSLIGALFNTFPNWVQKITKKTPDNMWAPDVNFFNGQYYVYYVGSGFGSRDSAIGLATANNVEGPYTDHGEVWSGMESHYLFNICLLSELRSYTRQTATIIMLSIRRSRGL